MASESEEQDKQREGGDGSGDNAGDNGNNGGGNNDSGGGGNDNGGGGLDLGGGGGGSGNSGNESVFGQSFNQQDDNTKKMFIQAFGDNAPSAWARERGQSQAAADWFSNSNAKKLITDRQQQPGNIAENLVYGSQGPTGKPFGLSPAENKALMEDPNSPESRNILQRFAAAAWQQESGRQAPNWNDQNDVNNFSNYLSSWIGARNAGQNPPGANQVPLYNEKGLGPGPRALGVTGGPTGAGYMDPHAMSGMAGLGGQAASTLADQIVSRVAPLPTNAVGTAFGQMPTTAVGSGNDLVYRPGPNGPLDRATPLPNATERTADPEKTLMTDQYGNRPGTDQYGNARTSTIRAPYYDRTQPMGDLAPGGVPQEPYAPQYRDPGDNSDYQPPNQYPQQSVSDSRDRGVVPPPQSTASAVAPTQTPRFDNTTTVAPESVPVAGPDRPDLPAAAVPQPPPPTPPVADPTGRNPLLVVAEAVAKEQTGIVPPNLSPMIGHIANGINALLQGSKEGDWAEPYLNKVAQLAWYLNENGGKTQNLPPDAAPASYIDTWKENWARGDESSPLQKDLNNALKAAGLQSPSVLASQRSAAPNGQALINTAMQEAGKPYAGPLVGQPDAARWGSVGWDCSSFVVGMYKKVYGVDIGDGGAYTDAIYKRTVAVDQPQPGDLVFYRYKDPNQAATFPHMGLYVSPGKVLDARGLNRGDGGGVGIHDDLRGVQIEYRRVPGLPSAPEQQGLQPRFTKLAQPGVTRTPNPDLSPPPPAPARPPVRVAMGDSDNFVRTAAESMQDVERQTGVPALAIAAVAANETGFGRSQLATKYNNFGGIKADPGWTGKSIVMPTEEERPDGSRYTINAKFRVYDTPQQGLADFARFVVENPRYKAALQYRNDPERFIREVHRAGYATDGRWADKIISIMRSARRRV